jgi:Tol biopolymer transport system component/actin-like ATPase involved in cell morphogenesis
MAGYQLGVDLGTTYTAAAVARQGRTEVATLGTRSLEIPSVAFLLTDGEMLVGEAAERRSFGEPDRFVREFKRRIGDPTPVLLGGTPFSSPTLTARLLRAVVRAVADREGGPPDHTVVTCPASWGDYKRDLLDQAVHHADIGPASLASEPEAAAVHYATTTRVAPGEIVAVYDLGGGTFDAAVLRNQGARFELLGEPRGIEQLGGVHFDEAVFAHVARQLEQAFDQLDPDDPATVAAVARLRRDCVDAKEALSSDTEVSIPVALPNLRATVRLTRSEFESMIRPALGDTVDTMVRTLRSAGVTPADTSAVLLVGGSSRIPLVGQVVATDLGRPTAIDIHPKHSVALGAAVLASAAVAPAESRGPRAVPVPMPAPGGPAPAAAPAPAPPGPGAVGPPLGAPPEPTRHLGPPGRGGRGRLWAAAAVALVVAGGLAWWLTSDDDGGGTAAPGGSVTTGAGGGSGEPIDVPKGPPLSTDTIAYTSIEGTFWNVWLIESDGSGARRLTNEEAVFPRLPAISPDRRSVVYTQNDGGEGWDLRVTDSSGDGNRLLVEGLAADARAAWSPDGNRLAYVKQSGGAEDLYVLDLGTGRERNLTGNSEGEGDPTWSPDGESIAYWARSAGNQDIYVIPAEGGDRRRLTQDPGDDADPAWHPDGSSLAFSSRRDGDWELFVMDTEGGGQRQLTDAPGDDQDPSWSPDGGFIAFESKRDTPERGDYTELYVMLADGGDQRRVTVRDGLDAHPAWGPAP